jgi:hypothetical protein
VGTPLGAMNMNLALLATLLLPEEDNARAGLRSGRGDGGEGERANGGGGAEQ